MTEPLLVILEDAVAGSVMRLSNGRLRFEYNDDYRARPNATPLSVSMPTAIRTHPDSTITPWLWGLLPDNEAVLARWAREFQASASSPFSLLATRVGHDCAGAVRFASPDEAARLLARTRRIMWLTDTDVEERLRDLKKDSTAWLGRAFTGQFSLAGARAKTALLLRDGRWGEPSGPIATTHILKPAVAGLDDHDLNEHLCLNAARRARLTGASSRVAHFGDETAIVVERYDRRNIEGRTVRIHQEDMCQALRIPPTRKYQNEGGPGPQDIVRLFNEVMPASAALDATWRLIDALAWNWVIAGTDAHAKNYSLLIAGDQVRLAPLYDIASALPYGVPEQKLRFAMKIGADYAVFLRRNGWPKAAAALGIDAGATVDRVRALAQNAPDAFADAARSPEVAQLRRQLPARLTDLVAQRSARCLELLG